MRVGAAKAYTSSGSCTTGSWTVRSGWGTKARSEGVCIWCQRGGVDGHSVELREGLCMECSTLIDELGRFLRELRRLLPDRAAGRWQHVVNAVLNMASGVRTRRHQP